MGTKKIDANIAINYNKKIKAVLVIVYIFIIVSTLSNICFADARAYNKIVNLKVENNELIVVHYHNWSKDSYKKRYDMITTHQNPFTSKNDYAYLECIEKSSGKQIFRKPTPALTIIYISSSSKYIIGLSKIMLHNPYQLVIFDIGGNLLYKKHIAASEAKLTISEFQEFKKKYKEQYAILKSLDSITVKPNVVYIDFLRDNFPIILGDAWHYLIKKETPSHLSENISESITNWVFWYHEPDPEIELKYSKCHQLIAISLLDPKGERFEIPIHTPKK